MRGEESDGDCSGRARRFQDFDNLGRDLRNAKPDDFPGTRQAFDDEAVELELENLLRKPFGANVGWG